MSAAFSLLFFFFFTIAEMKIIVDLIDTAGFNMNFKFYCDDTSFITEGEGNARCQVRYVVPTEHCPNSITIQARSQGSRSSSPKQFIYSTLRQLSATFLTLGTSSGSKGEGMVSCAWTLLAKCSFAYSCACLLLAHPGSQWATTWHQDADQGLGTPDLREEDLDHIPPTFWSVIPFPDDTN